MSNASYNMLWQEAMADLQEQVHLEDETIEMNLEERANFQKDNSEGKTSGPPVDQMDAFQHYACLYIKYLQIFRSLDSAYDNLVHPQKRIDLRLVLDSVMARVVELKHILVYWNNTGGDNGRNPDVAQDQPFAWEYVHMDDLLVDLKLPPSTLEVPIPTYFVEQREEQHNRRDRLIEGYSNLKLGVAKVPLEDDPFAEDAGGDGNFTLEEAIEILQRNERGRQGRQRAILVQELREEEKQRRLYESKEHEEMDPELAATQLQRVYRGYLSRKEAERDREAELVFIGMRQSENSRIKELETELDRARLKRKDEQKENRVEFDDELVSQHDIVRDEEGPLMKDEMMNERREWFTKELAQGGDFPEDLTGFYLMKNPPPVVEEEEDSGKGKDKKKEKKDDKKKDKKGKGEEEEVKEMPPPLTGPSQLTMLMHAAIKSKYRCPLFSFFLCIENTIEITDQ
jgi:IQ and AAA domain-containing protein